MEKQLLEKVISEIKNPNFESTREYLNVFEIELEEGKPKVQLIERDVYDDIAVVFVKIKQEPFFLAFSFSKENLELIGTYTENSNQIYFTATSKTMTFKQLSEMTKLTNLKGWSFDQLRPSGKSKYGFSRISYEPIENRAYDFETKLNRLVSDLKSDAEGVIRITTSAKAIVSIHHQMHTSANKGIIFKNQIIKSLGELNLGIDIDQYVYGEEIE